MPTNILAHTEMELRKLLDLSNATITRTDKTLTVLCRGKGGARVEERLLTLHCSGRWELSGYPSFGDSARIISSRHPVYGGGRLPKRDLRKIAATLRQAAA